MEVPTQESLENIEQLEIENRARRRRRMTQNTAPDPINRNIEYFEGGILRTINSILPLPIDEIDEREVYARFSSSELASYMINILKERIHTLRLILTIFVLIFTNLTNILLFYPAKNSYGENVQKFLIYCTPVWQCIWFILLIMGKNYSKFYIAIKLNLIGLISLTSIIAYAGASIEPTLYRA